MNVDVGLTDAEKSVLKHLDDAWNEFIELEPQTGITLRDFVDGIHRAQDQIALRVAWRANPDIWYLDERGRKP